MKTKINEITMIDFKGMNQVTYNFGNKTLVSGENGAGKSTIADAFYWVFADKDYELKSNPKIRPNDGRECTSTVIVKMEVDGKPVEVAKMQKEKRKEDNGNIKISLTNSYEVNSVQKSEKQFKEYMNELGFDFDKFLPLSHPDVFLKGMNEKKQKEQMRGVLFAMSDSFVTDLDIAKQCGLEELTLLLKNYTQEEIVSMQNSTKRKIVENYGKDGEILRAKIEGMEKRKTHVDIGEMKQEKATLEGEIKERQESLENGQKRSEDYKKLSTGVMELRFKIADLEREANADNEKKRQEYRGKINELTGEVGKLRLEVAHKKGEIARLERKAESDRIDLENKKMQWRSYNSRVITAQERTFDENSLVCAYCGQMLPEDKRDAVKSEFEQKKEDEVSGLKRNLENVTASGKKLSAEMKEDEEKIKALNGEIKTLEKSATETNKKINFIEQKMNEIPDKVDLSGNEEYEALLKEIAEKEEALNQERNNEFAIDNLKLQIADRQRQLREVDKEIALAEHDEKIDEDIAELRSKGRKYEQDRANCEKILYQIDLLNQRKNELLEESVNKHFKLVKWKLFDFLKNGSYVNDCRPVFSGKGYGDETNTGLEILMRLDIVRGLQNFYSQYYPVFIDRAESLDTKNLEGIEMDCQTMFLKVDDEAKLMIKEI